MKGPTPAAAPVAAAPPQSPARSGGRLPVPLPGAAKVSAQAQAQELAAREARELAPEVQAQDTIESLLSCYEDILSHSKSFHSAADAAGQVSLEWSVKKIIQSSETLMQIISNLKTSIVANNLAACNAKVDARSKDLKSAEVLRQQALVTLGDEVAQLLWELETNYYTAR